MSPMSAEATVVRNYLDWMIDLPWHKKSEVDIDLNIKDHQDRTGFHLACMYGTLQMFCL